MVEVGFYEGVDFAVEDGLHIAGLEIGAMVLYHLVRLKHVTANLTAPGNLALVAIKLRNLGVALLLLAHKKAGLQDLNSLCAVLVLAPLVLALYDDAGGDMRDTDGGADLVYVLTAGTAGTIKIDFQIVVFDFDINILIKFGDAVNGGEAGMASLIGIERADTHQPVHARLAGELTVSERACDFECDGADAGFLAWCDIELSVFEFVLVEEPGVHSEQHIYPVAAFGAARSGVDTEKAVLSIVGSGEQACKLDFLTLLFKADELGFELSEGLAVGFGFC